MLHSRWCAASPQKQTSLLVSHVITLILSLSRSQAAANKPMFSSLCRAPQQTQCRAASSPTLLLQSRICTQSRSHFVHYLAWCVLQAHFVLWIISSANLLQHSKHRASCSPSHRKLADSFFHTLYFLLHKSQMFRSRINHKKKGGSCLSTS